MSKSNEEEKKIRYCECQGPEYQGCMPMPNGLYACYKKDGEIDHKKGCLGKKKEGEDGVEGWTKGCQSLTYADLKERMIAWGNKLLQEGVYSPEEHQSLLKGVEVGTLGNAEYYDDEDDTEKGKEMKHIYGYYQRGRNKVKPINPSKKLIKNDFQKMLIQHGRTHLFLIANQAGEVALSANPEKFSERDWQIVDLGQDQNYALRSHYGRYLVGNEVETLKANRDQLSPWSQWKMEKHNEQYAFYSVTHKKYLTIFNGQAVIREGWNDNNLWNVYPKTEVTGGFLTEFNESEMVVRKDNLLADLTTFNTNKVENEAKRNFLMMKRGYLTRLRDQQRNFMLRMARRVETKLNKGLHHYEEELAKLKKIKKKQLTIFDLDTARRRRNRQSGLTRKRMDTGIAGLSDSNNNNNDPEYQRQLQRQKLQNRYDVRINRLQLKIPKTNKQLEDLKAYQEEVTDYFTVVKEQENEKLGVLIAKYHQQQLNWKKKAADQRKIIQDWIKEIAKNNKILENEIKTLRDEISLQLEDINNINMNIENGREQKMGDDVKLRGEINNEIRENQLRDAKSQFYIGVFLLLLALLMSSYMGYQSYKRIF